MQFTLERPEAIAETGEVATLLGATYATAGRHEEAAKLRARALDIRRQKQGQRHDQTLATAYA